MSEFQNLKDIPIEVIEAKLKSWRRDPVLYFTERLGFKCSLGDTYEPGDELDVHQKRILRQLPMCIINRKPLVLSSANAMGKDFTISGRATLWFYECFGPCKILMTGPTERQVQDIMWNELKHAYNSRPVKDEMGRLINLKLESSENWFITAFTTKETEKREGKFHGIHSDRMMIVVSEAQAVDKKIFEQIEGMTMADILLVCFLGNPLMDSGPFIDKIEDPANNTVMFLDAYDCINVKEKKTLIPGGLVNWPWVEEKERLWNADGSGRDPRYMARVRGRVPTTAINAVVSKELYKSCIHRELTWWSKLYGTIGVDPALTGADDMVISVFKSGKLIDEWVIPYNENETVAAGKVQMKMNEHFPFGGCVVVIDSDGLGIKVHNAFKKMVPEDTTNPISVIEYRGSCNARDVVDPQYENIRAEAHFYAKQRMMDGHICLDANDYAREEAVSVCYFTNARGRIQIEDKEDLKARLSRSPNRWDARVCAIWGFKFAVKMTKSGGWASDGYSSGSMVPSGGGSAMSA